MDLFTNYNFEKSCKSKITIIDSWVENDENIHISFSMERTTTEGKRYRYIIPNMIIPMDGEFNFCMDSYDLKERVVKNTYILHSPIELGTSGTVVNPNSDFRYCRDDYCVLIEEISASE